jgi:XTP/dITP diphosphohydrolase
MDELRVKCPWDRKQTLETLRPLTIEETYELTDAILRGSWDDLKEELGDVLLHLVFYARLASEQGKFGMAEVIDGLIEKLIRRHPHIYADVEVKDEEEVKSNWEKLKMMEGKGSVLAGVPNGLPAIVKALRIQEKAKKVGFEWDNKEDVWKKVVEEMGELQEAVALEERSAIESEFGDLLFSLVNYARFIHIDPEAALERTNRKFRDRFMRLEENALKNEKQLTDMSLAEMEAIWNKVKKEIG